MDKLKHEILKSFNGYLRKLSRGYPQDVREYSCIVDAMRAVGELENFTFPQWIVDATISYHYLKLKY